MADKMECLLKLALEKKYTYLQLILLLSENNATFPKIFAYNDLGIMKSYIIKIIIDEKVYIISCRCWENDILHDVRIFDKYWDHE